jgi:hypothetical protein
MLNYEESAGKKNHRHNFRIALGQRSFEVKGSRLIPSRRLLEKEVLDMPIVVLILVVLALIFLAWYGNKKKTGRPGTV